MEVLKHKCDAAMVRLLKPLEYYHEKYGSWVYGLSRPYLLMEKQYSRGQEGAGLACVRLEANAKEGYMFRERAAGTGAVTEVFAAVHEHYKDLTSKQLNDPLFAKTNLPFARKLYMGHLYYSTTGKSGVSHIHPFLRRDNWRVKNFAVCGNLSLINVHEVFEEITMIGQHPRKYSDTYIMLGQLGHRLGREVGRLYQEYETEGLRGMDITHAIEDQTDLPNVLKRYTPGWDGGFAICGITDSSESFSVRDPWGIRPAFCYVGDETIVLASERPVIQTAMNVQAEDIRKLNRGETILVSRKDERRIPQIVEPKENKACSFEHIYFSWGSDVDIYRGRKRLGDNPVHPILKAMDHDLDHTVLSFTPNTAEAAYFRMREGLNNYLNKLKKEWTAGRNHLLGEEKLEQILSMRVCSERVAIKDVKLRTFIAEGNSRNDLAVRVCDITYRSTEPFIGNLVMIDDNIMQDTTLRQNITGILDRLHPRKIMIVSSSPQVCYPDYHGIDMFRMNELIAFRTAVALLRDRGMEYVILGVYQKAKRQQTAADGSLVNYVKEIYVPFADEEISIKMVELLTPARTQARVEIVYQTLEGLRASYPEHPGD